MKFALAFILSLFSLSVVHAQSANSRANMGGVESEEKSEFLGTWKMGLRGREARDEFNQRTLSILRLDSQLEYRLIPELSLSLWPTLKAVSGHSQTENDFDANKSSLLVRQASADWKALRFATASAGILNQPRVHSSLLFDDWSFPGFRLALESDSKYTIQTTAFAQSTVPTSQSLSTNTKDFEATPSFNSGGAGISYENASVKLRTRLNYFEFKNLPSNLAFQSGLLGNNVRTSNNLDAQFETGFQGLESISEIELPVGNSLLAKWNFVGIRNQAAPKDTNQGYLSQVALDFAMSRWTLSPSYQFFRVEPDATVATFADDRIDTNRVGYRARMTAQYKKKFRIYLGGGEREVIYQSSSQSREHFYDLGLETFDAKF